MRSVLYYGETRIGVIGENCTPGTLAADAAGLLGNEYTMSEELSVRSENTREDTLTYEKCLSDLANAVRACYVYAPEISIDGKIIGSTATLEDADRALDAFLAAYSEAYGDGGLAHFEKVDTAYRMTNKEDLLTSEEFEALLALCAEREDLLLKVDYEKLDEYLDGRDAPVIKPVTVEEICEMRIADIPYETVVIEDDTLYSSQRIVESAGRTGVKELRMLYTYENGRLVSEKILWETVTVEPENMVIRQGTLPDGSATGSFIWTTNEGRISSKFGYRHIFGSLDFHSGIDVVVPTGTKLYAGDGGKVIDAGKSGNSFGTYVKIDHGNGFVTIYAHMSKVTVKTGDLVNKGDLIGYSGATGRVTGPHVHYEFRLNGEPVNPKKYLPER